MIGRICRDVPAEQATDVIHGYTIANDVTARDLQKTDVQFTRAKGFDSFCPLGPWIETDLDPQDFADGVQVQTHLNGDLVQDGSTADMIFDIPTLVAHVSSVMTLLPGDVILTGTPEGVGPMQVGDEVEVSIDGLGSLTNKVEQAMTEHCPRRRPRPLLPLADRLPARRASPARRSTTGPSPATTAAPSCSGSRTPTRSAAPRSPTTRCSSPMQWLGLDWDEGPSWAARTRPTGSPSAPTSTATCSRSCASRRTPTTASAPPTRSTRAARRPAPRSRGTTASAAS